MKTYITEGVGTFFLSLVLYAMMNVMGAQVELYLMLSLLLVVIVYAGYGNSHADYNPIISVARRITGDYTSVQLWKYVLAQCVWALVWVSIMSGILGEVVLPHHQGLSGGMLFVLIVVCSLFFAYIVLHATTRETKYHGDLFSVMIGLGFFLTLLFGGTYTGSIFNPALEISSVVVSVVRHGLTIQVDGWEKVSTYRWKSYPLEWDRVSSAYQATQREWSQVVETATLRHFRIYLLAPLVWWFWWGALFMVMQGRPFPLHLSIGLGDE